jgi:hypothetical protein
MALLAALLRQPPSQALLSKVAGLVVLARMAAQPVRLVALPHLAQPVAVAADR